ncbi:MAG TPA: hypothetical protein G4O15_08255 [Dehalococcoidia bacterium]|nr:hypothetical protein [Dehalococcoidia bacterium]
MVNNSVSRYKIQTIIRISSLILLLMSITSCKDRVEEADLLTDTNSENRYIPFTELGNASLYWNTTWLDHSSTLYDEITAITKNYFKTHEYVFCEFDCNDMAVDFWKLLVDRDIISLIVVGNLEKSHETFLECNHTWLTVYSGEGAAAVIDIARGKVFIWEDVRKTPQLGQYWEGFVYQNPLYLLDDFRERW